MGGVADKSSFTSRFHQQAAGFATGDNIISAIAEHKGVDYAIAAHGEKLFKANKSSGAGGVIKRDIKLDQLPSTFTFAVRGNAEDVQRARNVFMSDLSKMTVQASNARMSYLSYCGAARLWIFGDKSQPEFILQHPGTSVVIRSMGATVMSLGFNVSEGALIE